MTPDYIEAGKDLRIKDKLNLVDLSCLIYVIGEFFRIELGEDYHGKCRALIETLGIDERWMEQTLKILRERLDEENY